MNLQELRQHMRGAERLEDVLAGLEACGLPYLRMRASREWICEVDRVPDGIVLHCLARSNPQPTPLAAALQCRDRLLAVLGEA